MQPPYIAFLLAAAVTASPSPQPSLQPSPQPTLKTIEIEHSTAFCTALGMTVRPALAALLQNDKLIERGRTTFVDAGNRVKYGGIPNVSGNQILGPPVYSPSQSDTLITQSRQRALAHTIEENTDAIDTMLTVKKGFDSVTAADEKAKLSAIGSQLYEVVAKQRTAVNIISGEVEDGEMVALFNHAPSWGGADAVHGVSPLEAMEAGHGRDAHYILNVWVADQETTKVPFFDPYAVFARGVGEDQSLIAADESVASKSIMDAAAACK